MKFVKWEADHCSACKDYDPVFKKAMTDWNVPFEVIDVEKETQRAVDANIVLLPTTSIYGKSGQEVYRLQGKRELTELIDLIQEFKDA